MTEIDKILLNEGPAGIDRYCKKMSQKNDKMWASMFFVACIMVVGFWCTRWEPAVQESKKAHEISDQKIDEYKSMIYDHELEMDSIDNFYYGIKP